MASRNMTCGRTNKLTSKDGLSLRGEHSHLATALLGSFDVPGRVLSEKPPPNPDSTLDQKLRGLGQCFQDLGDAPLGFRRGGQA